MISPVKPYQYSFSYASTILHPHPYPHLTSRRLLVLNKLKSGGLARMANNPLYPVIHIIIPAASNTGILDTSSSISLITSTPFALSESLVTHRINALSIAALHPLGPLSCHPYLHSSHYYFASPNYLGWPTSALVLLILSIFDRSCYSFSCSCIISHYKDHNLGYDNTI